MSSSSSNDQLKSNQTGSHQWSTQSQSRSSRRGLAPISTSPAPFSSSTRPPSSASAANRNPWSPTNPSIAAATRQPTRSSSISSAAGHFSPPPSLSHTISGQAGRNRTSTSTTNPQLASAPGSSQGAGSGVTSARLSRASPSVSSPNTLLTPTQGGGTQAGQLSKIVIAQLFLLLSTIKEDGDKAKWESQVDQIRKLVDSNGMEVFTKYFRRLLSTNAPQIFGSGRPSDNGSSYHLLVAEIYKISCDPVQASKVAEAIDQGDGDSFKDFDLSKFMEHFKISPAAKLILASAFKRALRPDLRTKADAILSSNLSSFLTAFSRNSPLGSERDGEIPTSVIASLVDRLAQYPPRNWSHETLQSLQLALHQHYQATNMLIPLEIGSSMAMFDLLGSHNPLTRLIQRAGSKATENVETCKAVLESVELQDISYQQVANALLFMVIARDEPQYDAKVFISALREHRGGQRLDWQDVVHALDREGIKITKEQFKGLYDALMTLAREYENFDIQLLWGGDWHFAETQMSFASAFLSFSQDELDASLIPRLRPAYVKEDFEDAPDASERVQEFVDRAIRHPMVSLDASRALFNMVFRSSETYSHAQSLGVIENVINPNMDLFVCSVCAVPKPWGALQDQAVKQLITPMFLKNFETYGLVLHLLWKRDRPWMLTRLYQFWQQNPLNLTLIFEHAKERGWLDDIVAQNNELSLDLAALAHGKGEYNLDEWLDQITRAMPGPRVLAALSSFLKTRAEDDIQVQREGLQPSAVPLTVRTVHALLNFLGNSGLTEDDQVVLQRTCIQAYPRLINYGEGFDHVIDLNGQTGNHMSPDTDSRMQEFYKQMYSSEKQVRDIVEVLQKYKASEDPGEQDLFACMIYGLFDEYSCFAEYPLDALATTAVLFGSIINFHLLSRIALKTALAMVLEAVRDFPPSEPMYKFGLQALLHFKDRLDEWKMFSERLLHVPGLRGTQIYPIAEKVVREPKDEVNGTTDTQDASETRNVDDFLGPEIPEFTCLGVDPPARQNLYEDPAESVQESVLFILNNVSERNLAGKLDELRSKLQDEHLQWFANYLVDQRIKSQPNFHKLYLDMLEKLNETILWTEVLRESYISSFRMLNAETTMTSSAERAHLKNLGSWLGSITLARNKPIKYRNISFRDLLIEAYESQRLIVAIPFTCTVLTTAADSTVFKLPSAWTEEIVSILLALYDEADLKLSLKFEIEILAKALNVDMKKAERSTIIQEMRERPAQDEENLSTIADGTEGLNEMPIMNLARRGLMDRLVTANAVPELAELSSMLKHNYPVPHASAVFQGGIRNILNQATERAVQEIVGPVVDRSVTIAAISTSQLVAKDFALEPDETKYQEAAHTAVRSLAGSLALVTCKDPLKSSIQTHVRMLSQGLSGHHIADGTVIMFINDNLDAVCSIIEKAAEAAAIPEIDHQIEAALQARRDGTFAPGDLPRWNALIPEPYRQNQDGLNAHQLAIYTEFGRSGRGGLAHASNLSQDSSRQIPDVLQDQYGGMPLATPADAPALPRQLAQYQQGQIASSQTPGPQHTVNGYPDSKSIAELLSDVQRLATESVIANPSRDLLSIDIIRTHWRQIVNPLPGMGTQPDTYTINVARELFNMLYEQPMHPMVLNLMANLLGLVCSKSEYIKQDFYRQFKSNANYVFNADVVVAFLKQGLLDLRVVDNYCTNTLMEDNKPQEQEHALHFLDGLVTHLLPEVGPGFLRADLVHSISQLTRYRLAHPEISIAQSIASKLAAASKDAESPSSDPAMLQRAQHEYIFDEWVRAVSNHADIDQAGAFVRQMYKQQTLKSRDDCTNFVRTCVESCLKHFEVIEIKHMQLANAGPIPTVYYAELDALAKLLITLTLHHQTDGDDLVQPRARFFESLLLPAILTFVHYYQNDVFNSRALFRLLSSILCEVHDAFDGIPELEQECMIRFGKHLELLEPPRFPGFAFGWLSLVSHRLFMVGSCGHEYQDSWSTYSSLLRKALSYVGELTKAVEVLPFAKEMYRGMLKTLLVLHHDFPDFLADNHYELLNEVPVHCVQMRSLIISAATASFADLPDPFTHGLNVQDLDEVHHTPRILGDVEAPLIAADILGAVSSYLKQPNSGACETIARGIAQSGSETGIEYQPLAVNAVALNALVLHVAGTLDQEALCKTETNTNQVKLFQAVVEKLSPEGRYFLINAVANQLRYPNAHTRWFSFLLFALWKMGIAEPSHVDIQQIITRVLLERLIVHRPHPWGLIVTLLELLKNTEYQFWSLPFIKANPDIEGMFAALFQQMGQHNRT